jgi:mannitol-1-/sugar-/sorbitol-6-phosphatase
MQQFLCDAILCDLDGVLVDSTANVERHWKQWARLHGLDSQEVLALAHGRRTIDTMRAIAPTLATELEAQRLEQASAEDTDGIIAIAGARELVTCLAPSQWAVVTSGSRTLATTRLRAVGLPVPSVFITAEDVTEGKPHPEGYLKAADHLGVSPQRCIVIEDAPAGIQAARAAHMITIAVASSHLPIDLQAAQICIPSLVSLCITSPERSEQITPSLLVTVTATTDNLSIL